MCVKERERRREREGDRKKERGERERETGERERRETGDRKKNRRQREKTRDGDDKKKQEKKKTAASYRLLRAEVAEITVEDQITVHYTEWQLPALMRETLFGNQICSESIKPYRGFSQCECRTLIPTLLSSHCE